MCRLLVGEKINDLATAKDAMMRLLDTGVKTVVISSTELGSDNSVLALATTVTGTHSLHCTKRSEATLLSSSFPYWYSLSTLYKKK